MGLMAVVLVLVVCMAGMGVIAYVLVRRAILGARQAVADFVAPGADGSPSQMASVVQATAKIFAQEVTLQVKTSLMGISSGAGRAIDNVQADVVSDAITEKSPLIGALLQFSPSLRKRVAKMNPLAAMLLSQAAAGALGGGKNGKSPAAAAPGGGQQQVMGL